MSRSTYTLTVAFIASVSCADAGGDNVDAGPDAAPFECPHGQNPDGNGCYIPCEAGWHEGSDGFCHMDCLPGFSEEQGGECLQAACSAEESSVGWSVNSEGDPVAQGSFCVPGCPEGMIALGTGVNLYCYLPCPDGWYRDETTGRCHLECPEGMELVASGDVSSCELPAVGERKPCPDGLYDTSFDGPNPLYVDSNSSSAQPDGSVSDPFPSIMQAIAAGGDVMTVYVAPGTYEEQVVLSGQTEVNLIGSCADAVAVVGQGLDLVSGGASGAIDAKDIGRLTIDGLAITSDLHGIRVINESQGSSVIVRNVRIGPTALSGLRSLGYYDTIEVSDSTIEGSSLWGILVDLDVAHASEVPLGGSVLISGNEVKDLVDCVPPALAAEECPVEDEMNHNGVSVLRAGSATFLGNSVHGFERVFSGLGTTLVVQTTMSGNVVRDLTGSAGLFTKIPHSDQLNFPSAEIVGNVVEDCHMSAVPGVYQDFVGAFMGVHVDIFIVNVDGDTYIANNIIRRLEGVGISSWNTVTGAGMSVHSNELAQLPIAIGLGGRLDVQRNRVYDSATSLWAYQESVDLHVEDNHFADAVPASSFELRDGVWDDILNGGGSAISLSGIYNTQLDFTGNQVENCYDSNGAVRIHGIRDAVVESNFFFENSGDDSVGVTMDLYVTGVEHASISENVFIGPASGKEAKSQELEAMRIKGESTDDLQSVEILSNFVTGYFSGNAMVAIQEVEDIGHYTLTDNTFLNAGMLRFEESSLSHAPAGVYYNGNSSYNTDVYLHNPMSACISENNMVLSHIITLGCEHSNFETNNNLFTATAFRTQDSYFGVAVIKNNEFYFSSMELVNAQHLAIQNNVVNSVLFRDYPGTGPISDAIHIAGGDGSSDVEVLSNIINGTGRLGIIVSDSIATVEGNMYLDCGTDCAGHCDFVIQNEPQQGAVSGWDTGFATYPVEPYGVLSGEYI